MKNIQWALIYTEYSNETLNTAQRFFCEIEDAKRAMQKEFAKMDAILHFPPYDTLAEDYDPIDYYTILVGGQYFLVNMHGDIYRWEIVHIKADNADEQDGAEASNEPKITHAASLPTGWDWVDHSDGTGMLRTPCSEMLFQYNINNPLAPSLKGYIQFRDTSSDKPTMFEGSLEQFKKYAENRINRALSRELC